MFPKNDQVAATAVFILKMAVYKMLQIFWLPTFARKKYHHQLSKIAQSVHTGIQPKHVQIRQTILPDARVWNASLRRPLRATARRCGTRWTSRCSETRQRHSEGEDLHSHWRRHRKWRRQLKFNYNHARYSAKLQWLMAGCSHLINILLSILHPSQSLTNWVNISKL